VYNSHNQRIGWLTLGFSEEETEKLVQVGAKMGAKSGYHEFVEFLKRKGLSIEKALNSHKTDDPNSPDIDELREEFRKEQLDELVIKQRYNFKISCNDLNCCAIQKIYYEQKLTNLD